MSKSGREYFRLGAESHSSLGRVRKREENSVSTFGRLRLWTSFESSPVSVKVELKILVNAFVLRLNTTLQSLHPADFFLVPMTTSRLI